MVEQGLAACATATPADSLYAWQDEVVGGDEVIGLFKTSDDNADTLREVLEERHPYDTPCILTIPATANQAYERYVAEETR